MWLAGLYLAKFEPIVEPNALHLLFPYFIGPDVMYLNVPVHKLDQIPGKLDTVMQYFPTL